MKIQNSMPKALSRARCWVVLLTCGLAASAALSAEPPAGPIPVSGEVLDTNGHPLSEAMVTLGRASGELGATAVTVFTDQNGHFQFPGARAGRDLTVRLLGFKTEETIAHPESG